MFKDKIHDDLIKIYNNQDHGISKRGKKQIKGTKWNRTRATNTQTNRF